MPNDTIRYDLLVQDALRGVVRKVLADAARDGLPGDHHFYITFRTDARGVRLSARVRERFPGEMTIILQHQFRDLAVSEHSFEVGLSFSNIPEKVVVPFDAIVGFSDPSVEFGLKFAQQEPPLETGANDAAPAKRGPTRLADKTPRAAASEPSEVKPGPRPKIAPAASRAEKAEAKDGDKPAAQTAGEGDAKIVSIDSFRKKP